MIFGVGSPLAPGLLLIHARDPQGTAGHSLARSSGPAGAPQAELGVTSMGFWDPDCGWSLLGTSHCGTAQQAQQKTHKAQSPALPRAPTFTAKLGAGWVAGLAGCWAPTAPQHRDRSWCAQHCGRGAKHCWPSSVQLSWVFSCSACSCLTLKPRSFDKQGKPKQRGQRVKEPSPIPAHPKAPQSSCCQVPGALGRILCPGLEPPPAQLLGGQNSRLSTWDRAKAEHSTHSSENITTFPVFHTKSWMQSSSIPTQLALQVQSPPRTGTKSCPALLGMQTS